MEKFELIAPCHFGMEAVLKREILDLGYEITKVEDGKVTFEADAQGIADANIFLRSTERILLKVAEVKAETFDELFEKTKALPWENYIPKDGKFWVAKANSVKSKLFSPSDIQSIMKKAIVERLKGVYGVCRCNYCFRWWSYRRYARCYWNRDFMQYTSKSITYSCSLTEEIRYTNYCIWWTNL